MVTPILLFLQTIDEQTMFRLSPTCPHRCDLPLLLKDYKVGVEVGVLQAHYANVLLGRWPGFLHLVDCWQEYRGYEYHGLRAGERPGIQDHEYNYRWAKAVLLTYPSSRYRIWRELSSTNLASKIGNVDFAYIDANHSLEYVRQDLQVWWSKLNPGGMLAGHDLFQMDHPGVTEAVVLHATKYGCDVYTIPGKDGCPCGEGGVPSWYMYKPR